MTPLSGKDYALVVQTLDELRSSVAPAELRGYAAVQKYFGAQMLSETERTLKRAKDDGRIYDYDVNRRRGRIVVWLTANEHSRVVLSYDQEAP